MSHAAEYALKFTLCIFITWKLLTWRPRWNVFMPTRKSLLLWGYEVPNPHTSVLLLIGAIAVIPGALLMFAHHPISAVCAFLSGVGFFHLRNQVVRAENARGWHDPVWGSHMLRQRQADFERRMPACLRWITGFHRKHMHRED
jgi:hypothetical protein